MLSSLFASLSAKIAGAAIAATAAAGGLAAAGALPAPAQQAVSRAASTVGVNLPTPQLGSSAPAREAHAPSPAPTSTVTHGNAAPTSTVAGDRAAPTSTVTHGNAGPTSTVSDAANHGDCVSYATNVAASLGLSGSEKGQFVSDVAQDATAVSIGVSGGGKPDAACQASIDRASAGAHASSPGQSGATHGKGEPTATVTAGAGSNPTDTGHRPTNHPGKP